MKQIIISSNSTWNVQNFRLPVIRALVNAGYQVVVVAPVDESVSLLAHEPGVRIVSLHRLDRDSTALLKNILLWLEYIRIYRRLKPAVILHFTIKPNVFGNLAARICRVPSICVVTGLGYTYLHENWVQRLTKFLYKISFYFARKVVFENQSDLHLLLSQQIIGPNQGLAVPGCGVDTEFFHANGWTPTPNKIVFTFVGRLLFDKGVREFVEAAKIVLKNYPQSEFWIVGGLDEHNPSRVDEQELLGWVEDGIVQYKGIVQDVRDYMGQSDWIVLPSYREGLSRVLLEAMSMGKPIITTDTPGCRETVEVGVNGFLVPVKDTAALANVMAQCCDLPSSTAIEMGQKGRAKAIAEFESSRIGAEYVQIVEKEIQFL